MGSKEKSPFKVYCWKGTTARGAVIKGRLCAENEALIKQQLSARMIETTEIKEQNEFLTLGGAKKIKSTDIVLFTRQMSTMFVSGIPLVQALDIVASGFENLNMQKVILSIRNDVASGNSFSDALKKHPKQFNALFTSLVHAGEQAGILDTILIQLADYFERMQTMKGRVKKAMFYPGVMLTVTIAISIMLLGFVVPQFQDLFSSFGADLPGPTMVVIALSNIVQDYWWLAVILFVFLLIGHSMAIKRSEGYRLIIDRFVLKVPVFGTINQKAVIARVMRTLAISLQAGTPLVDALLNVAEVANNLHYKKAILEIREDIAAGQTIQAAMISTQLFPVMVTQMISIGEKAGELEAMLTKIADFYDEQVNVAIEGMSTLIEPIMIVTLGCVIAGFVVSMYLPIFRLGMVI